MKNKEEIKRLQIQYKIKKSEKDITSTSNSITVL